MKQVTKRAVFFHATFILLVTLFVVTNNKTFSNNLDNSMNLTAKLTDDNAVSLTWETIFEANYYKVFRAEVVADADSAAEGIEYVELGVSETNEFLDSYIKKDGDNVDAEVIKESTTYLYYVTAIDAWEKEIGKSNIVKFNLPIKVEETQ